jgi:hypothetical protein
MRQKRSSGFNDTYTAEHRLPTEWNLGENLPQSSTMLSRIELAKAIRVC